jgi:2-hydroxy-3-oxopropionate reductase
MWVCQAVRLVLKHGVFQGRAQQDLSRVIEIVADGTRRPATAAADDDRR